MPHPQMELAARAICSNRHYDFIEFKGEGTFKETFHVRLENGESAALKVCRPGLASERTDREIDAMVRCTHPNIARLLSVDSFEFQNERYLFLIEEYLSGGTLTERLQTFSFLSRAELLNLGNVLISALSKIASEGLVHRDIKPDNIMFRADGITPVIVDFGIVRDLASSSLTGTWQMRGPGTPYYAAPEQLNNEKQMIDWRTDQFALGIL
jgi:serine/threonine protein kinase